MDSETGLFQKHHLKCISKMYFFLINTLLIIIELLLVFQLRGWEPDDEFQIYDVFEIFFFYQGFLSRTLTTHRTAGEGRGPFLFHSTTSTRSWTFRHLFATLHVRWLSHIFNRNACIYQTATRWDFTTLSNYHLIDWWCEVCFSLFTWWFDTRFLLQQSWYRKPVDSNSHRLSPLYYTRTD